MKQEIPMKYLTLLLLVVVVPATAIAQSPGNGLGFAQISFGGGYETVINVTNRGKEPFNGSLALRPSDPARSFPTVVNGTPVSGRGVSFTLDPDAAATFTITSADASAGTLSGFARIGTPNQETAALLEGNLTYYVKSADGAIVDSVGEAPSRPFIQAAISFDYFETLALALANRGNQTANVRGPQVGTVTQTLASNQQVPKFLYQLFPGVSLRRGRVEIFSPGVTIIGTARTFLRGGQACSTPRSRPA